MKVTILKDVMISMNGMQDYFEVVPITLWRATDTRHPNRHPMDLIEQEYTLSNGKVRPADITIKKGETVRLRLVSDDVTHSLQIKGLGVDQTIAKGHPAEVTLTPKQDGDFQAQCGHFCGSGHGKMLMTVHVTGN